MTDRCRWLVLDDPAQADALLAHMHALLSPPDAERWDSAIPEPGGSQALVPADPRACAAIRAWLVAEGLAEDEDAACALLLTETPAEWRQTEP